MAVYLNSININNCLIKSNRFFETESIAISQLEKYLHLTTGYIAPTKAEGYVILDVDKENVYGLGYDGIAIELKGNCLKLIGNTERAVVYAVYEFLERYLSWRFFTETIEKRICDKEVYLTDFIYTHTPRFERRYIESYGNSLENPEMLLKHRLNQLYTKRIPKEYGGSLNSAGGIDLQGYSSYLSANEYYDSHPEYFAMDENGKRRKGPFLCLTNPEVYKIVERKIFDILEKDEDADFVPFSHDDGYEYCRCPDCMKEYKKHGAHVGEEDLPVYLKIAQEDKGCKMGTILPFVNKLAKSISTKYPKVKMHVLSYSFASEPPKGIEIEKNVIIEIAHLDQCRQHSVVDRLCRDNPLLLSQFAGWRNLTDNLWTWNYSVNFWNFPLFLPLIRTMYDDIKLYTRIGIKGMMMQSNWAAGVGFEDLFDYVTWRWLWDGDMSYPQFLGYIKEFLTTLCGAGAEYILAYLHLNASRPQSDQHYNAYSTAESLIPLCKNERGEPDMTYTEAAYDLFDKAIETVSNDFHKDNIERYRLSLDFYVQEISQEFTDVEVYKQRNLALYRGLKKYGVSRIAEGKQMLSEEEIDLSLRPSVGFHKN